MFEFFGNVFVEEELDPEEIERAEEFKRDPQLQTDMSFKDDLFNMLDRNHDGYITREEWNTLVAGAFELHSDIPQLPPLPMEPPVSNEVRVNPYGSQIVQQIEPPQVQAGSLMMLVPNQQMMVVPSGQQQINISGQQMVQPASSFAGNVMMAPPGPQQQVNFSRQQEVQSMPSFAAPLQAPLQPPPQPPPQPPLQPTLPPSQMAEAPLPLPTGGFATGSFSAADSQASPAVGATPTVRWGVPVAAPQANVPNNDAGDVTVEQFVSMYPESERAKARAVAEQVLQSSSPLPPADGVTVEQFVAMYPEAERSKAYAVANAVMGGTPLPVPSAQSVEDLLPGAAPTTSMAMRS